MINIIEERFVNNLELLKDCIICLDLKNLKKLVKNKWFT